ncbi:uncharacterized protein N7483_006694 [Penicillium malachiteum]|uniref:uncharacterized protein n=1 Tax=Penicillium malachiteum TaxID=1324776 RepID=UPI002546703B|nr:uncharacterized protein N7483_006694 [Penicillium malachiteum]KAJ5725337.1 hypothetical protein N7483_006694 [Penicillium malachiteum]
MANLQIVSDLHLEKPAAYDVFEIPPKAPYLALLGDIGVVADEGFFPFIETQLRQFKIFFFLLGNHEPYHLTWKETSQKIHDFTTSINDRRSEDNPFGKFVFLDQTRFDLSPSITILGCTLFSRVADQYREQTVEDHTAAYEADLKWLNDQVTQITSEEPQHTIIIFTHHSPLGGDPRGADPRHVNSPLSSGFATDLSMEECWKNPNVRLWAYGHTHYNIDLLDETKGKRIMRNQRGYYFSGSEFQCGKMCSCIGFSPVERACDHELTSEI